MCVGSSATRAEPNRRPKLSLWKEAIILSLCPLKWCRIINEVKIASLAHAKPLKNSTFVTPYFHSCISKAAGIRAEITIPMSSSQNWSLICVVCLVFSPGFYFHACQVKQPQVLACLIWPSTEVYLVCFVNNLVWGEENLCLFILGGLTSSLLLKRNWLSGNQSWFARLFHAKNKKTQTCCLWPRK